MVQNNFYTVRVEFLVEDEKTGKMKKQKESYLVDAISVTESEAKTTKYLVKRGEKNFEITAASASNIIQIIQ
jgi:hypothetical protein